MRKMTINQAAGAPDCSSLILKGDKDLKIGRR